MVRRRPHGLPPCGGPKVDTMPVFEYIAKKATGERVVGQLAGHSSQAVVAELESRSLFPVSVREQSAAADLGVRVSVRAMATFYRQLGELLHSGVPILRALQLLSRSKSNPKLGAVVGRIAEDVSDGESLADSMAKHPRTFQMIHIAMVRAGERGGFLEEVLKRLSMFLNRQAELRSTILSSLIYPIVLVVVGTIVVVSVMIIFVPKFRSMLEGIGTLPLPTRIVMGASDLLTNHGWLVMVLVTGVAALLVWGRQHPAFREWMSRWSLRLWIIGPLVSSTAVARFCRILGTLLANGIPMLQAMTISKEATGNAVMVEAIEKATRSVQQGETLAEPLAASGLFEEDVIEVIRIGESANNLEEVLVSIAETIESRVDRLLSTAVRLLEPLLLLLLGATLLFIILALVVPLVLLSARAGG